MAKKKSSKKAEKKQEQEENEEENQPELWDIKQDYGSKGNDTPKCMVEGCSQLAVACWVSNLDPEPWNTCEICQENDFGGWPPEFIRKEEDVKKMEVITTSMEENIKNECESEIMSAEKILEQPENTPQKIFENISEEKETNEKDKMICSNDEENLTKKTDNASTLSDHVSTSETTKTDRGNAINDKGTPMKDDEREKNDGDEDSNNSLKNDESNVHSPIVDDKLVDEKAHKEEISVPNDEDEEASEKQDNYSDGVDRESVTEDENKDASVEDELWTFKKLYSFADLESKKPALCMNGNCTLVAACAYVSNLSPTNEFSTCLDCQQLDYGGWPEIDEMPKECFLMTQEHIQKIQQLCSRIDSPKMPPSSEELCEKHESSEESPSKKHKKAEKEQPQMAAEKIKLTTEENTEEELWTFTKLFSIKEIRSKNAAQCNTADCNFFACVTYTCSNDGSKWSTCLDCQELDYGGWPDVDEIPKECLSMTEEHKEVLTKLCTTKDAPRMPQNIIEENNSSKAEASDINSISGSKRSNPSTLTPPPKCSKENGATDKKASFVTPSPKQPSSQALALHQKWQLAATALGGKEARIVVSKDLAKKIIFDKLKDSFRPMNITDIHKSLKAVVPQPILKNCLDDMTYDEIGNPFDDDGSDEDDTSSKNKKISKKKTIFDTFASTLLIKAGRNNNTTLYYVDYNKLTNNGNGLLLDERNELITASQSVSIEEQDLKIQLKKIDDQTKQLLSEPTNEEANNFLENKQNEMSILEENLDSLRAYKVNESIRKKVTKRIDELTSIWRKRQRICKEFLIVMEECTEGVISMKKCLSGDGQMYLEGDNYAIQEARNAAKAKKGKKLQYGGKKVKVSKLLSKNDKTYENKKNMNPTETFVGVKLDNSGKVTRVHLDDEDKPMM